MIDIAIKDNQNPASIAANGSMINTARSEIVMMSLLAYFRLKKSDNIHTESIINARCVGIEKPARAAYVKAPVTPDRAANRWEDICSGNEPANAHSHLPTMKNNPATRPICKPEIASR